MQNLHIEKEDNEDLELPMEPIQQEEVSCSLCYV